MERKNGYKNGNNISWHMLKEKGTNKFIIGYIINMMW